MNVTPITFFNMENMMFIEEVEQLHNDFNINYIDAIILWCDKKGIELESMFDRIKSDRVLVLKLKGDAEELNYMKKSASLDFE